MFFRFPKMGLLSLIVWIVRYGKLYPFAHICLYFTLSDAKWD